ncbi:MAG: MotA/TolQ/ExbB proton channel family protein [Dysgonamonadaceae bacterium]|jgi:biopolymer transport protein ExbB|nr:MotA/TolQ/ExbB proton channel family protein [Dysgonamonadaceae bacterium]
MKHIWVIIAFFAFSCMTTKAQDSISEPDKIDLTDAVQTVEQLPDLSGSSENNTFFRQLKTKFIEGNPYFMSIIALTLILGLACCVERIIYLHLADVNSKKLIKNIEDALEKDDVEAAKNIARNTRGPIASIIYQGLMRIEQDVDVIDKSITSYGNVQTGLMERNFSWISLFIAMAPSLGFLGTVLGLIQTFEDIEQASNITPGIVADGMKVALITTVAGLIVALILQLFYNYIINKDESIVRKMEDASISLLDIIIKYKAGKSEK